MKKLGIVLFMSAACLAWAGGQAGQLTLQEKALALVNTELVAPLNKAQLTSRSFSRVRLPERYRFEADMLAGGSENEASFVLYQVTQSRFSFVEAKGQVKQKAPVTKVEIARGRYDDASGKIMITQIGTGKAQKKEEVTLEAFLKTRGVVVAEWKTLG